VKKSALFGLLLTSLLVSLAFKFSDAGGVPAGLRSAARSTALPFRAAALYAREPEATIPVPVEGVRASQVKDTWGRRVPRGVSIRVRTSSLAGARPSSRPRTATCGAWARTVWAATP
jgi:hypothetical protein